MNFLDGTVDRRSTAGATIRLVRRHAGEGAQSRRRGAGSTVALGIRPDAIALAEPGSGELAGTVAVVEQLGGATLVYVAVDGIADLVMVEAARTRRRPGGRARRPRRSMSRRATPSMPPARRSPATGAAAIPRWPADSAGKAPSPANLP